MAQMKKYLEYWNKDTDTFQYNGLDYETFDGVLQDMLGFCGCGMPDEAQKMIMKALQHIKNLKDDVWTKKIDYEQWNEDGRKLFGDWEYVIYYLLDNKKLTEHGGSVPGWLSDDGEEMLELLKSFYI